ncbi:MAG: helix-turn-helix transcriptional regulator [Pseudomonadota bacterium]
MESQLVIILSAMSVAMAVTGMLVAHRGPTPKTARGPLAIIFFSLAGLCGLPLTLTFSQTLALFYLPALLPLLFLLPVAIYNYAKGLTEVPTSSSDGVRRDMALPLAGLAVMLGYWSLSISDKRTLFLQGELPTGAFQAGLALMTFLLVLMWCVTSLVYLLATLRLLRQHRYRLKQLYSNTDAYDLYWLDGHVFGLIGLWTATAMAILSDNLGPATLISTSVIYGLTIIFLLTLIGYSLTIVPSSVPIAADDISETGASPKYARSALSTDQAKRITGKIDKAMRETACYLDPQLTLAKLSQHIQAPQNHVSQTLNTNIGMSFFDYVAHWRVEASKPLLASSQTAIHDIALEVGFNARSTFYKAFKRETGMTPRAYRLVNIENTKNPEM